MKKAIEILNEQIAKTNELLMLVETEYEEQYVNFLREKTDRYTYEESKNTYHFVRGRLKGLIIAVEELEKML